MISLKRTLDQIEAYQRRVDALAGCYLSALASIERHAVPSSDELLAEFQAGIEALRRALGGEPDAAELDASRAAVDRRLKDYREKAVHYSRQKDREVREIINLLAGVADAMNRDTELYGERFRGLTSRLESVIQLNDLREIRQRLGAEVAELKSCVESMNRQATTSVSKLHSELVMYRTRLEDAERMAATDPLTGAANRRHGERQLEQRIGAGTRFCILLFDLDRFKQINDTHGHACGDQVLRAFAGRLMHQVRACDLVCRWGGDEFLVILECGLKDAINRAKRMSETVRNPYRVQVNGQEIHVRTSASVGVAERQERETRDELFARADSLLYGHKKAG